MRVVGGKHKSRLLKRVLSDKTRETADMVKQAVFNMLNQNIAGNILDLFAGAGSYGIEALSRGASLCYFVDNQKKAVDTILANLESLNETNKAKVIHNDVNHFLKNFDQSILFDYVFLDPPYELILDEKTFEFIEKMLNDNAQVIIETSKSLVFNEKIAGLTKIKDKTYGIKRISIFRKH